MSFKQLCTKLEQKIKDSYENGVTLDEAEKLAAEFLYAQIQVSKELKEETLNSRMRKAGLKAVRAAILLDEIKSVDKKPTESVLQALVDSNKMVMDETDGFDKTEVQRDELERYYNVFREAHIYYRGVSKGRFE